MIVQKLDILKESGVIDQEIYNFVIAAMEYMSKQADTASKGEQADSFYVHLAMAAARQKKCDPPIDQLDPALREEIESNEQFPRAKAIWEALENLSPVKFGQEERDYFYLHICTMLQ